MPPLKLGIIFIPATFLDLQGFIAKRDGFKIQTAYLMSRTEFET